MSSEKESLQREELDKKYPGLQELTAKKNIATAGGICKENIAHRSNNKPNMLSPSPKFFMVMQHITFLLQK